MKGTIVYDRSLGHIYIPAVMPKGVLPFDIPPYDRIDWLPMEFGHSAIPKGVRWFHGCWVETPASVQDVVAENVAIRTWHRQLRLRLAMVSHNTTVKWIKQIAEPLQQPMAEGVA